MFCFLILFFKAGNDTSIAKNLFTGNFTFDVKFCLFDFMFIKLKMILEDILQI